MNLNERTSFSWLRELDEEELATVMTGDLGLVYSLCGIDVLIKLCENFLGMNIYVSSKPVKQAAKLYVKKYWNGKNHKELAVRLGVSERYIYEIIRESKDD